MSSNVAKSSKKRAKKSKNEQKRAKMRKNSGRSLFPTSLHEEVIPFRTSAKHFVPGTAYQTLQPNTTVPLGRHTRVPATNKACDTSSHKELVLLFFFSGANSHSPLMALCPVAQANVAGMHCHSLSSTLGHQLCLTTPWRLPHPLRVQEPDSLTQVP